MMLSPVVRSTLSVLTAVFLLAGCAAEPRSTRAESAAMWEHFPTLDALVQASDVVVRAEVMSRSGIEKVDYGSPRGKQLTYTDTNVSVEKYVRGSGPNRIVIRQLGSTDNGGTNFADLPLIKPGSKVLLFLNDITADPRNLSSQPLFMIVSPEGLYEIYGNRLITVALGTEVTDAADKTPLDAFERMVESAAK
jgi:hypothetical protein